MLPKVLMFICIGVYSLTLSSQQKLETSFHDRSELMFAMDYSGQRENGRHYKPQQWLLPGQIMKDPPHELIMKFLNEKDIAIQERNLAISEKKSALTERDMAIMQRDAAISERNNALMERDNAMAALAYRENSALNNMSTCPPGCGIPRGAKHIHQQQHMHHHQPQFADPSYNSREIHIDDAIPILAVPTEAVKPKRGKRTKELKSIPPKKVLKPSKKGRNNQVTVAKPYEWKNEQFMDGIGEDFNKQHSVSTPEWKGSDLGLNQVNFEDSTVPVPVCSCTGVLQPCYKWGKGGWQSACCTTTLSMYPLPVMPNKRNSRLGGRKMSGSAFAKLLSRLAAEGHDVSTPLDLKDHWSKHGTNRYITIK